MEGGDHGHPSGLTLGQGQATVETRRCQNDIVQGLATNLTSLKGEEVGLKDREITHRRQESPDFPPEHIMCDDSE